MMNNYFVTERLSRERMDEALREATRVRLVRLAEASREQDQDRNQLGGKVRPDAAGAWEVPSL